jgi:hypothetical protein
MKKTTLIIGWESSFAQLVARELGLAGRACIVAAADAEHGGTSLPWRPDSLASTRSVIIEALNVSSGFDEAVLIAAYQHPQAAPADAPDSARTQCDQASGFAMCARELSSRLHSRNSGKLILIHPAFDLKNVTPERAMAYAAIEAFSRGLAEETLNDDESIRTHEIIDISDSSPQRELVAQLIVRLVDRSTDRKNSGFIRFTGKPGIFNLF